MKVYLACKSPHLPNDCALSFEGVLENLFLYGWLSPMEWIASVLCCAIDFNCGLDSSYVRAISTALSRAKSLPWFISFSQIL